MAPFNSFSVMLNRDHFTAAHDLIKIGAHLRRIRNLDLKVKSFDNHPFNYGI